MWTNSYKLYRIVLLCISLCCIHNNFATAQKTRELIVLDTRNTSLVLTADHENVFWSYFGSRLNNTQDFQKHDISSEGKLITCFAGQTSTGPALRVTHANGGLSTELQFLNYSKTKVDENSEIAVIRMKDQALPFFVTVFIKSYYNEDVFETWCEYRNEENGTVTLNDFASTYLPVKAEKYFLTNFYGIWFGEMKMEENELLQGTKSLQSIQGIRTTHNLSPSFIVSLNTPSSEDEGEVIGGSLAWSGSWKITFEKDWEERLNIIAGINSYASSWSLKPKENFQTPRLIYTFSNKGKGQMSRNFHSWARRYAMQDGGQIRPLVLNSWEGNFFDFDESKITTMIKNGAEMGIEMFVLDDGWFGSKKYPRENDQLGLGDWEVNQKRFPRGLEPVIETAKKLNIQMGIWVEPEMVNPRSELFEKHPEWALQEPGRSFHPERNQYVLDLTNPEVKNFVFNSVHNILKQYPYISYVKWDCNSPVTNPGSLYLGKNNQEQFWIRYIQNFYAICDSLIKTHPEVMFQVCASGGGRVDYGSLPYFHEFWASDNTDALQRIFIQHGTSFFFPAAATAAHVTKSPNGITQRVTPLKYRFDVAMSGRMGIELLPADLNKEELGFAKKAVETYKSIRPVVQSGNLYRLKSPYETSLASLMYVDEAKTKAVVFVYQTQRMFGDYYPNIRLKGLDPEKKYKITEINMVPGTRKEYPEDKTVFNGEFLMKHGLECVYWGKQGPLTVNLMGEYASAVFLIELIP